MSKLSSFFKENFYWLELLFASVVLFCFFQLIWTVASGIWWAQVSDILGFLLLEDVIVFLICRQLFRRWKRDCNCYGSEMTGIFFLVSVLPYRYIYCNHYLFVCKRLAVINCFNAHCCIRDYRNSDYRFGVQYNVWTSLVSE